MDCCPKCHALVNLRDTERFPGTITLRFGCHNGHNRFVVIAVASEERPLEPAQTLYEKVCATCRAPMLATRWRTYCERCGRKREREREAKRAKVRTLKRQGVSV